MMASHKDHIDKTKRKQPPPIASKPKFLTKKNQDGSFSAADGIRGYCEGVVCLICKNQEVVHTLTCGHRCCKVCIHTLTIDGTLSCPYCNSMMEIPAEGFPVCKLTEYLKGQLMLKSQGDNSVTQKVLPSKANAVCNSDTCEREIDVRCGSCSQFLCYRCGQKMICSTGGGNHETSDVSDVAKLAALKLENWKKWTKLEVDAIRQTLKRTQRELDDKLATLKTAEFVDNEKDDIMKIMLVEQISQNRVWIPPDNMESMRLQYVSTACLGSQCNSVAHHGDNILIGCAGGLKSYDSASQKVRTLESRGTFFVDQCAHKIFCVFEKGQSVEVLQYSDTSIDTVFSFKQKNNYAKMISITSGYIAVLARDNDSVKLYNRLNKCVSELDLPSIAAINNLSFTSDGSLLITGGHMLAKYSLSAINSGKQTCREVWSIKEGQSVNAVAEAENGLIFLAGGHSKSIHIYTAEGGKIKTLKIDKLPDYVSDISIKGNELAVAGWNDHTMLLFKAVY